MTAQALAALHRQCFTLPPPWSAQDFASLLADSQSCLLYRCDGSALRACALFRVICDEAELLTLATAPDQRQSGLARALMREGLAQVSARGARVCFLEVAADNRPAIALYTSLGFTQAGTRRGYYRATGHAPRDALVFRAELDSILRSP